MPDLIADLPRDAKTGRFAMKPSAETATQSKRDYNRDRGRLIRAGGWAPNRVPDAAREPSAVDIAWAAGFLEGEGSFTATSSPIVTATQVNREPLERLQEIFGGSIKYHASQAHPAYYWRACGNRARTVMDAVYELLSQRRRSQIDSVRERTAHVTPRTARAAA